MREVENNADFENILSSLGWTLTHEDLIEQLEASGFRPVSLQSQQAWRRDEKGGATYHLYLIPPWDKEVYEMVIVRYGENANAKMLAENPTPYDNLSNDFYPAPGKGAIGYRRIYDKPGLQSFLFQAGCSSQKPFDLMTPWRLHQ